ncbi:unnamed protein product [Discosporangium mesarthrocarpum]
MGTGNITEDEASELMKMARDKDVDLTVAFDGCFQGDVYKGELDEEFFLVQAKDLLRKRVKQAESNSEGKPTQSENTKTGSSAR